MSRVEQEKRAMMRKRFLKSLDYVQDKRAIFHLHENTTVFGNFVACDYTPVHIHVSDLQTPSGSQKRALLRVSDIVAFNVKVDDAR